MCSKHQLLYLALHISLLYSYMKFIILLIMKFVKLFIISVPADQERNVHRGTGEGRAPLPQSRRCGQCEGTASKVPVNAFTFYIYSQGRSQHGARGQLPSPQI